MRQTLSVFLAAFLLFGCGPKLIDRDVIPTLTYSDSKKHHVIYYNVHYTVSPGSNVTVKTHRILRLGENLRTIPELLTVFDGSVERLKGYEAVIRRSDGSRSSYGKGDLVTYSLSNRSRISESFLKILILKEDLASGDVIETASLHEFTLSPLGIYFDLADIGSEAENILCTIELPASEQMHFKVVNDSTAPEVTTIGERNLYTFMWKKHVQPGSRRPVFQKRNTSPAILVAVPPAAGEQVTWREFGDWYLNLVDQKLRPTERVSRLAREITHGIASDKEKLDAIFDYCQRHIRYEQVYLDRGEFIPNLADVIVDRKYGDCKDYSTIIYTMARSLGINANLALCYRGTGMEFHEEIPVSQFNHMIVHYEDDGTHRWYDGTNRTGLPGITTDDLINARALVLRPGASALVTIEESTDNLLEVQAKLHAKGDGLTGTLAILLTSQYSIDFFIHELFTTHARMQQRIIDWVKTSLNRQAVVKHVEWEARGGAFQILASVDLPNCVTTIPPHSYVSFARIFPELMPAEDPLKRPQDLYYYPLYSRLSLEVALPGFIDASLQESAGAERVEGYRMTMRCSLPTGPFTTPHSTAEFLERYVAAVEKFNPRHKLIRKE
jgi:hypothetical protein